MNKISGSRLNDFTKIKIECQKKSSEVKHIMQNETNTDAAEKISSMIGKALCSGLVLNLLNDCISNLSALVNKSG